MVSSGIIRLLDFLIFFGYYLEYCLSCGEGSFFSLFVSGVCLIIHILVSCFLYWVCWVRGNFSGGPGHIFSVCVTPLCGVPGRYNFIRALSWSGWRDCTDFSLFSGSVVAGTVRLKW
jgi:hypothetical protein